MRSVESPIYFGLGEVLAGAETAKRNAIVHGRYGLRDVMPGAMAPSRRRRSK